MEFEDGKRATEPVDSVTDCGTNNISESKVDPGFACWKGRVSLPEEPRSGSCLIYPWRPGVGADLVVAGICVSLSTPILGVSVLGL